MRDVFLELRTAYFQQLNDLSVAGEEIPCYDTVVPDNISPAKAIIISTQTDSQVSNKHANISDCTVLIDVVTTSTSSTGRKPCDLIADAVLQVITTANLGLDNFQLVTTKRISNDSLYHYDGSKHIYRRLIRFSHKVVEN